MNHGQLQVIEYLREENRVVREQLGRWRVRLNDHQRRSFWSLASIYPKAQIYQRPNSLKRAKILGGRNTLMPADGFLVEDVHADVLFQNVVSVFSWDVRITVARTLRRHLRYCSTTLFTSSSPSGAG
jgi:hypothetical protein